MSDQRNGGIVWTEQTWNPLRGCSRVSAGCMNCYAEGIAARFCGDGQPYEGTINTATKRWNGTIKLVPEKLAEPLRWKRPRMVFVNSMSDLFHEDVTFEYIDKVFAVMALASQHTFQVLTKRPERMKEYFSQNRSSARWESACAVEKERRTELNLTEEMAAFEAWPLPNVWLGVTVENQESADERIPLLLQTPAAVRWVSMEPLLGPVKFRGYTLTERPCFVCRAEDSIGQQRGSMSHPINCGWRHDLERAGKPPQRESDGSGIDWVVVGGESGKNARPMHPDWARSLRDQCASAGVQFLFKQWGEFYPTTYRIDANDSNRSTWDSSDPVLKDATWHEPHEFGNGIGSVRIGKKVAGRLLDGVQHDGYPEVKQ